MKLWLIALGALAAGGCAMPMEGLSVEKAPLSETRPEGTIGPNESKPPWQTYTVSMPTRAVRRLVAMQSTFHLRVTDCRRTEAGRIDSGRVNVDGLICIEDVYVDGVTLNGSSRQHPKLEGGDDSVIRGVAYVSTSRIGDVAELCFQASGGTMLGSSFKSNVVRVRR